MLKLFEFLSKENFLQNLILFQQIVSFLAIIPFYFISKSIIRNKYLVIITTIFYGCWHPLINQNVIINPECLCIVGSTLSLFLFVRYFEKPTKFTAISIGLFPFILIMLKPSYLIALFVVLFFLIMRFILFREERILLYWGLLALLIAVTGVLSYCEMNKKFNGEFVLSKITLNNSIANIIISGAYKHGGDKELITIIDTTKHKGYYTSVFFINNESIDNYSRGFKNFPQYLPPTGDMNFCLAIPKTVNYSYARISHFVKKSQYTMTYFKYIIKRMIDIFVEYINLFLILILESIIIVYAFVKYKKVAWVQSLCILFVVGQFITIAIGGIDDTYRLLMPSYPFIIPLVASFFGILISSLNKDKLIKSIL